MTKERTYKWRAECVRSGHVDPHAVAGKLRRAVQRHRISEEECKRLQETLAERIFRDVDPIGPPARQPCFEESDSELLWRAGILQRKPRRPVWTVVWYFLWFALVVALVCSLREPTALFPGEDDTLHPGLLVLMAIAFVPVRVCYNKWYKGEWLLDEALACLRDGMTIFAVLGPAFGAFWALIFLQFRPLMKWFALFAILAGSALLLHIILRIVGRAPHKHFLTTRL